MPRHLAPRPGPGRLRRRLTRYALAAALIPAAAITLGPGAHADPKVRAGANVHLVRPGESVQAAVDAAGPGDIIELAAGTHPGSVHIATDHVTLRGPRDATAVLTPAATAAATPCAAAGHGVCIFGTADDPVAGVRIEDVTVTGFRKTGVIGRYAHALSVSGVHARGNGEHGIGQEFSRHGLFTGNTTESNGQSGLFVADETTAPGTVVARNHSTGNRIGVHLRRTRHTAVTGNEMTGNCAGVFLVGDETRPVAGDVDIVGNTMADNNRYCPGNQYIAHIQGSGIVLTGTQQARVTANRITGHRGDSPMSGGIVMVPSFAGDGTSFHRVTGNTLARNDPADLAERDPRATGNTYLGNVCGHSEPAGLCRGDGLLPR
ncbi:right-handed parallel beta-helix repeat-containing protein [Yinghuangia soli]|uniref:Right-handed parallel beta-helix repeat-containing protein n=1 Tax=Yinghuangia soli TaxID=2908204 RepID=A0AA41U6L5_9ACTN|nr:right-handed parallel beta-helix repeat-containing protein [Yinghuangia soli]MCF2531074.1 right-handed parallel beta-helix repeat-containing protein [Yinghuangia soli]